MKRLLSMLLATCLVAAGWFNVPAHAEEMTTVALEQPQEQPEETSPIVVSTLDELQVAVDDAENGDTIALSEQIRLSTSLTTDKEITIVQADNYTGSLFLLQKDSILSGFSLVTNTFALSVEPGNGGSVIIADCSFIGVENPFCFLLNIFDGDVKISNCIFEGSQGSAIKINSAATVEIESCSFANNHTLGRGGAIWNDGICQISNSKIHGNSASVGGGISNGSQGTLTLSECTISGNNALDGGSDIYSEGTLYIVDAPADGSGFYEETIGEKITLPFNGNTELLQLVYLTDEEATIRFTPQEPDDEDNEDTSNGDVLPPTLPEEPADPPGAEDNNAEIIPPETPPEVGSDDEEDYSPPVDDRPTYYPPAIPQRPEKPAETPVPALACGNATIDVSRSVVLAGYEDGALHEEDPLTRAQIAAIIFRLLTDETIEQYDGNAPVFEDVPTDAWYYRYVSTIARAGIVAGTGNGYYTPDGLVTWAQAVTILTRFVEAQEYTLIEIRYSGWALQAVQTAAALGWIEDAATFDPDSVISRGELVSLVNGVLENYR